MSLSAWARETKSVILNEEEKSPGTTKLCMILIGGEMTEEEVIDVIRHRVRITASAFRYTRGATGIRIALEIDRGEPSREEIDWAEVIFSTGDKNGHV